MIVRNIVNISWFTLFYFLFFSCNTKNDVASSDQPVTTVIDAYPFYFAKEFVGKLKKQGVDTILFSECICINCCEFFNVFWVSKGQRYLNNINALGNKTVSSIIPINNDSVFSKLFEYYDTLKKSRVKDNEFKNKDGNIVQIVIDHYCYGILKIYLAKDSIITREISDDAFEKFVPFAPDTGGLYPNINYKENLSSKWNLLLVEIDSTLAKMPGVSPREKGALRTRKQF